MKIIKKYWLHVLFILVLIGLIVLTYQDYGIIWDEKFYLDIGKYFLAKIFQLLHIKNNLVVMDYAPVIDTQVQGHGVIFDILLVFLSIFSKTFTFETNHLIKALAIGAPTFILLAWIIRQIFDQRMALIAMIFLLLFPRFYGEIFQSNIDTTTTLSFALYIAYFIYFLKSGQNTGHQLLLAMVAALVITQRLVLGYLLVVSLFILLMNHIFQKKSLLNYLGQAIFILVFTFIFMHLFNPYLYSHPIFGIKEMIAVTKKFPWTGAVLFEGQLIWAYTLPWYYLPKSIAITIPEALLFLNIIGVIDIIYLLLNKKNNLYKKQTAAFMILITIIPFVLVWTLKPTLYNTWRQFLFLTIPLIILAVYGLDAIFKIKHFWLKAILLVFITLNFLFVAKEMITLHPYEYIYYNQLVGGLGKAYGKYETDYNGAGYKEAIIWFNNHINDNKSIYKISIEGDYWSSVPYFKKNMVMWGDIRTADYYISFTRWNLHERYPAKTIHIIERQGVPLVFIKKI